MIRRLAAFLAAVLAVSVLGTALATGPAPFSFRSRLAVVQQPVENQTDGQTTTYDPETWVMNPTQCAWDTDDSITVRALGSLDPGQSWSYADCVVSDNYTHVVALNAGSSKPGVVVSILVTQTGRTNADAVDTTVNHTLVGSACLSTDWYAWDDPILQPIPGSDGGDGGRVGIGYPLTITWTIANEGTHRADVDATLDVQWPDAAAMLGLCPNGIVGEP